MKPQIMVLKNIMQIFICVNFQLDIWKVGIYKQRQNKKGNLKDCR